MYWKTGLMFFNGRFETHTNYSRVDDEERKKI